MDLTGSSAKDGRPVTPQIEEGQHWEDTHKNIPHITHQPITSTFHSSKKPSASWKALKGPRAKKVLMDTNCMQRRP